MYLDGGEIMKTKPLSEILEDHERHQEATRRLIEHLHEQVSMYRRKVLEYEQMLAEGSNVFYCHDCCCFVRVEEQHDSRTCKNCAHQQSVERADWRETKASLTDWLERNK